jgi:hypothetical protein
MTLNKKTLLFCTSFLSYSFIHAQIEVAHFSTKNFSATGFGTFLNVGIPINQTDAITPEIGLYYFNSNGNNIAAAPLLLGYRHLLNANGDDFGFYVEPVAGYSFGGTDIQKLDQNGNPEYGPDGNQADQKVTGVTTGLGFGYLFRQSGWIRFNIGLRYEHTFVSNGDPATNIFALRVSHSFSFGRRED